MTETGKKYFDEHMKEQLCSSASFAYKDCKEPLENWKKSPRARVLDLKNSGQAGKQFLDELLSVDQVSQNSEINFSLLPLTGGSVYNYESRCAPELNNANRPHLFQLHPINLDKSVTKKSGNFNFEPVCGDEVAYGFTVIKLFNENENCEGFLMLSTAIGPPTHYRYLDYDVPTESNNKLIIEFSKNAVSLLEGSDVTLIKKLVILSSGGEVGGFRMVKDINKDSIHFDEDKINAITAKLDKMQLPTLELSSEKQDQEVVDFVTPAMMQQPIMHGKTKDGREFYSFYYKRIRTIVDYENSKHVAAGTYYQSHRFVPKKEDQVNYGIITLYQFNNNGKLVWKIASPGINNNWLVECLSKEENFADLLSGGKIGYEVIHQAHYPQDPDAWNEIYHLQLVSPTQANKSGDL